MYQLSQTFGYQSSCTITAEIPNEAVVTSLGEMISEYETESTAGEKQAQGKVDCKVRMFMKDNGSMVGESEGEGFISVTLLGYQLDRHRFMIQIDLNETPHWMKCGGEECTCDSADDGECSACCWSESCYFCDGQVETVTWLTYQQAKDLLAEMAKTS